MLLQHFINDAIVIELEQSIKLQATELRKVHHIKLPDAIIAATALVKGFKLITRNISDFKNIFNLELITPWEL